MCGIVGYFELERTSSRRAVSLETMLERLRHRGPNDSGIWRNKRAALGHTRLAIIDVPGGHQPIANEDGSVHIVYNGEIYNFLDLRSPLMHRHQLRTRTDTEVVVHWYEDHGPDCVKFFDGMFAFALVDGDELFLARDPLGVKPLYYALADGRLYFASEIKALLPITSDIIEFPPGHWFHSQLGWKKYWDLSPSPSPKEGGELPLPFREGGRGVRSDWAALVRDALSASVTKRLISDVPVGVFLSGGLDSSLVAALMKEHIPGLHSFSVGTPHGQDPHYARRVAQYLGTIHHEYIYSEAEMLQILPTVIYHLESFDFALVRSAIANYFVARLARDFVKVVLVGEGADELFGGYHYLKEIADEEQLRRELVAITSQLHNSNLQRVDRMTMAHGLEGREPYLDLELVQLALEIPAPLKRHNGIEKYILRKAFEGLLPHEILWREKEKFSRGAGSALVFEQIAEREIPDREFARERHLPTGLTLRSKEELYYYRIWRRYFPDTVIHCLSWTHRPEAR
ncbi:Asparagine synthetase B [glutamine-hydrolyzing] [bacterium HR07]|uniref:asparagine synthase (glutamine-hydrolyzing) n=1 Tax=Acetithermum autotrophicum TaxID=1446466 RepID=H5SRD1_ACEAU|nr:asparagine synthase, glutamine-hydrolyzing [Candidatus Acetothermum autotrophicum]GBC76152.1 Asparagine synthetase B [glutamine-hydrolyzing] [bacterium HR07]